MKQTKKTLVTSVISLLLCIAMLLGSTFAWFTDSVSSLGNKIQAGFLQIDLELLDKASGQWHSLKETQEPIFNYDKWEPGYVDVKILKIENEGNLALKWISKFYSEKELSILADVIDVYVCPSDSALTYPTDRSLNGYTNVGTLRSYVNTIEETTWGTLDAYESAYLGLALKMREEAGNEYQGLSLGGSFDIRIFATQYTSESDSFDNMYDKDATFDIFTDKSILTSQSKELKIGAESVDFTTFHKGTKIVSASVPEDAIADKSKPVSVSVSAIDPYIAVSENSKTYAYDIKVSNLKPNLTSDQLVTVVIGAPKGLAAMKVYHKDELVQDAVYDEVAGTITFKTASFSPFAFEYTEVSVASLTELRNAVKSNNLLIKLTQDLEIDLSKGGADRSADHVLKSDSSTYYNAVNIVGQNVAIDLNGHGITVSCGSAYNSNSDVGALFYVGANGSLNIVDETGEGFIKMASSIYAIWAPYADPSYVDIYSGAFIADSYAGDPIGTALDKNGNYDPINGEMKNENSNRALIYAGFGGNINVYGGYFLYNNTPNDTLDRNNGAFNAKDHHSGGQLITIHEGVYLINKEYRQNPANTSTPNGTFDDISVVLSDKTEISKTPVNETKKIDNVEYSTWYKTTPTYKYKVIFMNSDGTKTLDTQYVMSNSSDVSVENIDDDARKNLDSSYTNDFGGWVNAASEKITSIKAGNTKDVFLRPTYSKKYTVTWLNEDGAVLNSVQTSGNNPKYSSVKAAAPSNPESKYYNEMKFSHWEVRTVDSNGKVSSEEIYDSYSITRDISLYPVYEYNGSLDLIAVDTDGDGVANHYAVAGSDITKTQDFIIPNSVNGIPVIEIRTGAFADGDLRDVVVPKSITYIGQNAFCANNDGYLGGLIGGEYPQIQIIYEGTKAEWDALIAKCPSGWDDNIGANSQLVCLGDTTVCYYNKKNKNTGSAWDKKDGYPDWFKERYPEWAN